MRKAIIPILVLFIVTTSCNKKKYESEACAHMNIQKLAKISSRCEDKDTTLIFDLDNISLEGTEAIAHYKSGIIDSLTLNIYGETGQSKMSYLFYKDCICVSEKRYKYLKDLLHVKSDKDIFPKDSARYALNYKGKLIEGDTLDASIGIFEEIYKKIPFNINNED